LKASKGLEECTFVPNVATARNTTRSAKEFQEVGKKYKGYNAQSDRAQMGTDQQAHLEGSGQGGNMYHQRGETRAQKRAEMAR